MIQKITPGKQAIYNGKNFVKEVTKSIKNNSYSVHKYSDNTDINSLHEQYGKVAIEGYPFMNIYGSKANHSILIIDDHGKKYRVEMAYQSQTGSTENKIPFKVYGLIQDKTVDESLLVLGGGCFSDPCVAWANQEAEKSGRLQVLNLDQFSNFLSHREVK